MAYEILIPLEEENQYLALETRYQLGGQINISVKAHLAQRKNELENSLNIIMSEE